MPSILPEKLFYKIGEVAEVAGVRTSVLRFWESEFSFLKPVKSSSGQRLYSKDEVDLVLQVRNLLYDEKFTIEGVKKRITAKGKLSRSDDPLRFSTPAADYTAVLKAVRSELKILRDSL
ncbi:MAG: MerR family transcriptional regulator [Desulfuromonadaceae bacterium]|nr:MerR family transcriptional regulator [Desulfuromonadaceae bacterium]